MRQAVFYSTALHVGILALTAFTWPNIYQPASESPSIVPVDLVTLADTTNIAPTVEAPIPEAPPPDELIAPEARESPAEAAPEPAPEPEPEPPPPEKVTEAKPEPAPKPPTPKPTPPKKDEKTFDVNSIIALLDQRAPATKQATGKEGERTQRGIGEQNAMTMNLQDAIKNQVAQCWNWPAGAPNPENLVVEMKIFLNADGSIARAPQLTGNSAGASNDPFVRAAVETARRALYVCQPYKLPAESYGTWKEFTMIFDPRKMAGQ